jgi:hypothetical protein
MSFGMAASRQKKGFALEGGAMPPHASPAVEGKASFTLTSILSRDGKESFPLTLALSLVGEREIKELGFHRPLPAT